MHIKAHFFVTSCTVDETFIELLSVCLFLCVHHVRRPVTETDERRKGCTSFLCVFETELLFNSALQLRVSPERGCIQNMAAYV